MTIIYVIDNISCIYCISFFCWKVPRM